MWLGGALALLALSGCEFKLTNLTPDTLPENPSQIYTLSLRVVQRATAIVPGSVEGHVIIDGENHPLKRSTLADDIWEYEYSLPAGREEVAYYFLITYKVEASGRQLDREAYTDVQHVRIARRNVVAITANRGPIGSRIGVLGRGFTGQDRVFLDGTEARTTFESSNSLSFIVPAVQANQNYRVSVNGPSGNNPIGTFRVDPGAPGAGAAAPGGGGSVQVSPSSLNLRTGQRAMLTVTIPFAAPAGGLLLQDSTDVQQSVIMPEVIVPGGQNSVRVQVEGGTPGSGSIFLKSVDGSEIAIPITVTR